MDIPLIQEEINELRMAWVLADRRMEVAMKMIAVEPVAALTNIDIAIQTCNHIKSRLDAVKMGMNNGT
jgi:hypothetical protein